MMTLDEIKGWRDRVLVDPEQKRKPTKTKMLQVLNCLIQDVEDTSEALSAMEADRDMYRQQLAFEKDQRIADGQGREVGKLLLRKQAAQEAIEAVMDCPRSVDYFQEATVQCEVCAEAIKEKFSLEI
jgi:predicted phage tail protein